MVAVETLSPAAVKRRSSPSGALHRCDGGDENDGTCAHGLGGQDLRRRWIGLVSGGHVTATTTLTEGEGNGPKKLRIRYGVRLDGDGDDPLRPRRLLEFVEILPLENGIESSRLRDRILSINATLAEMQKITSGEKNQGLAIRCVHDGPYAAQLQLIRTLRPPRSKDFGSGDADVEDVSCRPPPYDASKDSFLVGPLRLFGRGGFHGDGEPRERTARLSVPGDGGAKYWDVYHNVSPMDPRGHYLLLPAMDDKSQWRDQSLVPKDCHDLTYLASMIDPPGSMALFFNSVGAGASQNHIHVHACLCPPPPLLGRVDSAGRPCGYAATRAPATKALFLESGVSVSLLDYPCTCVKLSATLGSSERSVRSVLKELGNALAKIVLLAQRMDAPHNAAWTNSIKSKNLVVVDAYVFFRRAELTNRCRGAFRMGFSEMFGVFFCSSEEQLESLGGNMAAVLRDVSLEPRESVWEDVKALLS